MYLPFVMLGYAGILCLLFGGFWLVSRTMPSLRGTRELNWAIAMAIASVLLVGLRPWAPAFLSILLGNCTLCAYFLLVYWATARILGQRTPGFVWLIGLCLVALLPFSFYAFIRPDITARILLEGGVAAVVAVATAILLFRQPALDLRPAALALGCVQVIAALLYVGRSVASLLDPPIHFVRGDWTQTAFTYGQMLARVGTCCGVLWLAFCVYKKELERLAMSDSLTGLLNRRAFDSLLLREMERHQARGESLGLILVDIDRFKDVNDTYGHVEGDAVLRLAGEILKRGIRPGDALARYGGEEFAVLLQRTSPGQGLAIAERLRAEMERAVMGPKKIRVTASFGVAESDEAETALELLQRCDRALYRSKRDGRNRLSSSTL